TVNSSLVVMLCLLGIRLPIVHRFHRSIRRHLIGVNTHRVQRHFFFWGGKRMPAKKKSGRFTLRIPPETHARLERAASTLGMDTVALVNLLIHEFLPLYEFRGKSVRWQNIKVLIPKWKQLNPNRDEDRFFLDIGSASPFLAENGRYYKVNDAGTDFEE